MGEAANTACNMVNEGTKVVSNTANAVVDTGK
jgi:hypothetical protein